MRFRPTALICIGMFASAALVGVIGGEETPSEQGPADPAIFWPKGPVVEILGINEAVSYPERMEEMNPLGSDPLESHLREAAETAKGVGARWTRGHTVAFPRLSFDRWKAEDQSWARFDAWIRKSAGNVHPVMIVHSVVWLKDSPSYTPRVFNLFLAYSNT